MRDRKAVAFGLALTILVAADFQSGRNKYVEGVFRLDYFPYYYLGAAYLELRQYDKAEQDFTKVKKNDLPRPLLARFDDYQKRLASEVALAHAGGNPPPP